jgi:hypothetical protein
MTGLWVQEAPQEALESSRSRESMHAILTLIHALLIVWHTQLLLPLTAAPLERQPCPSRSPLPPSIRTGHIFPAPLGHQVVCSQKHAVHETFKHLRRLLSVYFCVCMQVFDCHTGTNQRWYIDTLGRIHSTWLPDRCLDVSAGMAVVATCSAAATQRFDQLGELTG